jgi:hypothetical protein
MSSTRSAESTVAATNLSTEVSELTGRDIEAAGSKTTPATWLSSLVLRVRGSSAQLIIYMRRPIDDRLPVVEESLLTSIIIYP